MEAEMAEGPRERAPELFFAFVYPVGTDADRLVQVLSGELAQVEYTPRLLHLIDSLSSGAYPDLYERYKERMNQGNKLREQCDRADAFALYCASEITKDRATHFPAETPVDERITPGLAYIIRSLKRPEEIDTLRAMYGDALIVVAAHSPRQARSDRLTWEIARSGTEASTPESRRPHAEELIARDEREAADLHFGQRVSDTFPMADVFVDASDPDRMKRSIARFVEILFGHPFHTPTRMEYGMFHAQGAALRSSDLSRQVGAAIANDDGEIVALGTNEVPKGGGGMYWEDGSETDSRDFTYGYDVSTDIKRRALRQVLKRLHDKGWLTGTPDALLDQAWLEVEGTDLMNVGEFGRGVHAEMSAIVDAARRGISIAGTTLYTTTFPCHVCARHIVSAGIARVIYNEPYPKSLARFLHLDSISIDDPPGGARRTSFVPFVGLAPRLYVRLFEVERGWRRNPKSNEVTQWNRQDASPRLNGAPATYIPKEVGALNTFAKLTDGLEGKAAGDHST